MKALVVGGTGFIGSHIISRLISRGFEVRVMARWEGKRVLDPRVESVHGSISDPASLKECCEGMDLVFSAFGVLGKWGIPERTYWDVNREGVRNLLQGCLGAHIRQFIHISSAGVLGPLPNGIVADESFARKPSNVYERTKCQAEEDVLASGLKHGLPFTIIRPEFVYGPGDIHVLGLFRAISKGRFFVLGKGDGLLHPTYIDDLMEGILLCIDNEAAIGQTFLITGETPLPVKEMATIIANELDVALPRTKIPLFMARVAALGFEAAAKVFGLEPAFSRSRLKFFTQNRAFSVEKARRVLGYDPKIGFREGVSRTVRWYRENGYI